MQQLRCYGDDRNKGFCVHCGGPSETVDHVPSKVLLDEPYPENLMAASACRKCNNDFSIDEEYLACLLEGGEDPRFICRRLILSASEDVGLADPQALPLAVACQQAVEFVGMPEGYIPLAETVVYLALARKSNSTYAAYANAAREVKVNGPQSVPLHLRNASTQLQREWGYGKDYKYPHNFPQAWVEQDYLPPSVRNRVFYQPKEYGEEPRLASWSKRLKRTKPENR